MSGDGKKGGELVGVGVMVGVTVIVGVGVTVGVGVGVAEGMGPQGSPEQTSSKSVTYTVRSGFGPPKGSYGYVSPL